MNIYELAEKLNKFAFDKEAAKKPAGNIKRKKLQEENKRIQEEATSEFTELKKIKTQRDKLNSIIEAKEQKIAELKKRFNANNVHLNTMMEVGTDQLSVDDKGDVSYVKDKQIFNVKRNEDGSLESIERNGRGRRKHVEELSGAPSEESELDVLDFLGE